MNLNLFEHNKKAYDAAVNLMNETGKAAVIHPTGTGKSFIAFQLAADHPQKSILWVSPSEYIYQTQLENLKKTLPDTVESQKFFADMKAQIQFLTYSKLMINKEKIDEMHPDYIVLDEFHRCGATEWGKSVGKLLASCKATKVLGLSATNIRYLDNQRDMADELFDGCIASQMSLGEAIARGILPTPTYVVSMYSYKEEIERLQKKVEAEKSTSRKESQEKILEQLRRSLEQADGLDEVFARHMKHKDGKYIVFCADKEHMYEMISHTKEWFRHIDRAPHVYSVYYDNPETSQAFKGFKEDRSEHLKLLFCIDMLNEGVHVDGVDGVILLRPTVSPILYLQQIGRGLSAGSGKGEQPIIFDIVNNFDSLYSIDGLEAEFEENICILPYTEHERSKYKDAFRIIDEMRDARALFQELSESLHVSWDAYYLAASLYFQKNGNLKVTKNYVTADGLNLGMWLTTQRRVYAGKVIGNLSKEQIVRLNAIGMDWENGQERKFQEGIEALRAYKEAHGDTDVNIRYKTEDGYALGRWVGNMRAAYKKGALIPERKAELDAIGMIWDAKAYRWNRNYEAVAAYYEMHGNIDIPSNYVDENGNSLAAWLHAQKSAYQNKANTTPLSEEQIRKLESLNIQWSNKYEDKWQKWYALAELYYKEHGDLKVRSTYCVNGQALGKWISAIRLTRKEPESSNRNLTEERIRQLDAIGMSWE